MPLSHAMSAISRPARHLARSGTLVSGLGPIERGGSVAAGESVGGCASDRPSSSLVGGCAARHAARSSRSARSWREAISRRAASTPVISGSRSVSTDAAAAATAVAIDAPPESD